MNQTTHSPSWDALCETTKKSSWLLLAAAVICFLFGLAWATAVNDVPFVILLQKSYNILGGITASILFTAFNLVVVTRSQDDLTKMTTQQRELHAKTLKKLRSASLVLFFLFVTFIVLQSIQDQYVGDFVVLSCYSCGAALTALSVLAMQMAYSIKKKHILPEVMM